MGKNKAKAQAPSRKSGREPSSFFQTIEAGIKPKRKSMLTNAALQTYAHQLLRLDGEFHR